ncbi:MAG: lipoprotein signal peptidase [Bacteroidaceae bacterium]|nr:lipoprotein signal peptidase [Bacteroidaceae bacterium]
MELTVKKRNWIVLSSLTLAVVIDQVIKIIVKTSMTLGESISVFGDWCQIKFIENNGMAFGMEFLGKTFLTSFRIIAVSLLGYYLYKILKANKHPLGYMLCIAFILAGALGNIFDCLFYGEIFSSSHGAVAEFVPWGEGYSSFMHGEVVDMFYFPLFTWPDWVPFVGGDIFFSPVFNIADACISCAIVALLIFYRRFLLS